MRISSLVALFSFVLLFTLGCEETVDPVLDSDQPFTLYGFFNPRADTQAVRVFPIEPTLSPESGQPLDATVTSTDLVTGETIVWRDSVVTYADGSTGHVAWAPLRVAYGHTYKFAVARSDGAESQAEVPVPGLVELERLPPYTRRFANRVNAAPFLPFSFNGEARLIQIDVNYEFEVLNVGRSIISVPYDGSQQRTDDGWVVEIDLSRDFEIIVSELLRTGFMQNGGAQIELNFVTLTAMVINGDWNPPGGRFDPAVLVEPGAWTNVQNGFGFVGGGYMEETLVFPTGCHKSLAGFYVPEGNPCRAEYEE